MTPTDPLPLEEVDMPQLIRFLSRRLVTSAAVLLLALTAALFMGTSVARASSSDCPLTDWCGWNVTYYGEGGTGSRIYEWNYAPNTWFYVPDGYTSPYVSVFNNRANATWFSWWPPPPNPAVWQKDCMITRGGRPELSTWHYGDGSSEYHNIFSADEIQSGTTCP